MRVLAALGGNALLRRGQPATAELQRANVVKAAAALAPIAVAHELIITHGNGPQVGLLALQAEAYDPAAPYPLDILDAESEGMIGYLLEQALHNELRRRPMAAVLTQVIVDSDDPAFANPTKPIGPVYTPAQARQLADRHGWHFAPDETGWRRTVPSPQPLRIVELPALRLLMDARVILICVGGGGIPVTVDPDGRLCGIEAVIDKDLSAAALARELDADVLMLLTDVSAIECDHGTPRARPLTHATPAQLNALPLPSGSMGPKAAAAAQFVRQTGHRAVIGRLSEATALLEGRAGTQVQADAPPVSSPPRQGSAPCADDRPPGLTEDAAQARRQVFPRRDR